MTRRLLSKHQQGQAMVEMAMVLLIFVFVIFGITEFSRALYTYNTLVWRTRAAARWAVVNGVTVVDPVHNISDVQNYAVYGNPAGTGNPFLTGLSTANVLVNVINNDVSNTVVMSQEVTVSIINYQFNFLVPFVPSIPIGNVINPALTTSLYTESMGIPP